MTIGFRLQGKQVKVEGPRNSCYPGCYGKHQLDSCFKGNNGKLEGQGTHNMFVFTRGSHYTCIAHVFLVRDSHRFPERGNVSWLQVSWVWRPARSEELACQRTVIVSSLKRRNRFLTIALFLKSIERSLGNVLFVTLTAMQCYFKTETQYTNTRTITFMPC